MKKKKWLSLLVVILVSIFLLLPIAMTFIYSISRSWTDIVPKGITGAHYKELFTSTDFIMAVGRTLLLCIVPIVVMTVVILLALYNVLIYHPKLEKYLQILCMIPYAIQGVILSVSILSLYTGAPLFLSNHIFMLNGAYCIVILPYMYQGIRNSMNAVNMPMLLEAAEILGSSKLLAFFKVIIPNILSGITTSALLSFGIIFGDYVLINNIVGNSFSNVQIYLYWQMRTSSTKGSAVFMIIFLVTLMITGLVLFFKNKEASQKVEV